MDSKNSDKFTHNHLINKDGIISVISRDDFEFTIKGTLKKKIK